MNALGMPFNSITTELSLIVDNAITHQDPNCESYARQVLRGLILYRFPRVKPVFIKLFTQLTRRYVLVVLLLL
jgi:hypothetical protein